MFKTVKELMTATADKIRTHLQTTDKIASQSIPDKVDEVYEAGRKSQYDEDWDNFQNYGQRDDYNSAFCKSGYEYIRPKHKIRPTDTGTANNTFIYASKLKKIEAEYFDFSQVPYGTWAGASFNYTFCSCSALEEIEDIGLPPTWGYTCTFIYDYNLHTIAKITVDENTRFDRAFDDCSGLINLTMAGTIGQNGFNVQWSKQLTHDSLMSIINALKDYSGTDTWKSITLGADNIAKLTTEELKIMDNKQWEYA